MGGVLSTKHSPQSVAHRLLEAPETLSGVHEVKIIFTITLRGYLPLRCVDICTDGAKSRVSKAKVVGVYRTSRQHHQAVPVVMVFLPSCTCS